MCSSTGTVSWLQNGEMVQQVQLSGPVQGAVWGVEFNGGESQDGGKRWSYLPIISTGEPRENCPSTFILSVVGVCVV